VATIQASSRADGPTVVSTPTPSSRIRVDTSAPSASTHGDDHRRVRQQRQDREERVGDVDVVHLPG
jgi:hypothetical protein